MGTFPEQALAGVNALAGAVPRPASARRRVAPLATLVAVSVLTGLAMLWVVGRLSNQAGMAASKRAIQAAVFEMRLFNDRLPALVAALGRALGHNARYVGYTLVPLAWMTIPLLLLIAQLQAFYGYAGLTEGAPVVLTLRARDVARMAGAEAVTLEAPGGVRVETPAVVLPGAGEVTWRLVPTVAGEHVVTVRIGSQAVTKTLHVGEGVARRSPRRVGGSLVQQMLYPSEPPLPLDVGVTEVRLAYPEASVSAAGLAVPWLVVFVAVSMVTAFAFARRLGVVL